MRLHFPTKDESEHYIICSDNGDFVKLFEAIHASRSGKEEEKPSAPPLSNGNAPYEKYLSTPGKKGMLLNDGMIKYHTTGDISTIQIEDGKGVTISSEGNIELLANNISLNGGEKIKLSAEKKIEMTCGGSSIVIDGEEEREDFKAMELYLESPFNVDVDIMPPSEVEKIFRAFAEERKRALPQFTPDGIPITLENKFDDAIYNYLYEYWKTNSGEYDPKKDVIPESEMNKMHPKTKNEFQFEKWLLQQYGMTNKEQREYTVKGNLESLWEIFSAADMVLLVKALPNIGKNLVQLGKDVLENGIQFDTSLGIVAGGGEIWNLKNTVDDVAEEAIEKTVKREVVGEVIKNVEKLKMTETVRAHMYDIIKKGKNKGELSRPYSNSNGTTLLLNEIMKAKLPVKDNFLEYGLRWDVEGIFRGSTGIWELVIDTSTNTIMHFNFVN